MTTSSSRAGAAGSIGVAAREFPSHCSERFGANRQRFAHRASSSWTASTARIYSKQQADRRIIAPVTLRHDLTRGMLRGRFAFVALPCGGAKLQAFSLEHVVEAPLGKFDASREPEIPCLLHMLDDATQG
jgi:hypothetical protein